MSAPTAQPAQPAPSDPPARQAAHQVQQGPLVLQGQAYPAPLELQVLEPQVLQVLELLVLQVPLAQPVLALPVLLAFKGQPVLVQPALKGPPEQKALQACLAW
jgi:hypothetical protein